jgi:hypothetical protein
MKVSEFVSLGHASPNKTHDATQGRSNEVIVAARRQVEPARKFLRRRCSRDFHRCSPSN